MLVAPSLFVDTIRVCLFGGEIRWTENFGEKIGRNTFLSVFGWMRKKKINGRAHVFSPRDHQKVFSLNGEKIEGRK